MVSIYDEFEIRAQVQFALAHWASLPEAAKDAFYAHITSGQFSTYSAVPAFVPGSTALSDSLRGLKEVFRDRGRGIADPFLNALVREFSRLDYRFATALAILPDAGPVPVPW